MERERKPKQNLTPLTVRFGDKSIAQIKEISDEFLCSKAHVVRVSSTNRLDNYFGHVRFYTRDASRDILNAYLDLTQEVNKLRLEIKCMGRNLDEITHLKRLQKNLQDEKDELLNLQIDESMSRQLKQTLVKENEAQIENIENQIAELKSQDGFIDAYLFSEESEAFMKQLDEKLCLLQEIATQRQSYDIDE